MRTLRLREAELCAEKPGGGAWTEARYLAHVLCPDSACLCPGPRLLLNISRAGAPIPITELRAGRPQSPRLWPCPCGDFPIVVSCPGCFLAQAEVALVEGFHADYSAFLVLDLLGLTLTCGVSEPLMGTFCPQISVPFSPRAAAT